jgi:hypothetical protein
MGLRDSPPEPSAPRKVESGTACEVWQVQSNTMRIDWSRKGIIVLTLVGHGNGEFAAPCLRRLNEALRASERLKLAIDCWEAPGYDTALRIALTEWMVEHRSRIEQIHVLARAPMVRMGVSVANLALGGLIKTYALRPSYEVAVKQLSATHK